MRLWWLFHHPGLVVSLLSATVALFWLFGGTN